MSSSKADRTERQKEFARQYVALKDGNAAYRCSHRCDGLTARSITDRASAMLNSAPVQAFIEEYQRRAETRINITTDMVVERWWAIATADPNVLIRHRRLCCRYCYGLAHRYQWVDMDEWALAAAAKIAAGMAPIAADGGIGFDKHRDPNDGCSKCKGEGVGEVYVADTAKADSVLYAGVKQTRDGIVVLLRDQDKALDSIARWLGMYHDRQPGAANGNPVGPALVMQAKSPAEASKIYARMMAGGF